MSNLIMCTFHVSTTFYWFRISLNVSLLECKLLPNIVPESLPVCFTWIVWFTFIKIDLNKHSWNTHLCSPNTHQDGSSGVGNSIRKVYIVCAAASFTLGPFFTLLVSHGALFLSIRTIYISFHFKNWNIYLNQDIYEGRHLD